MQNKNKLIMLAAITLIICLSFSAGAMLIAIQPITNTATIKGIGVTVEPNAIDWGTFDYNNPENKTKEVLITNLGNTPITLDFNTTTWFSNTLYPIYEIGLTVEPYGSINATITLVYMNGEAFEDVGTYNWTTTVTAIES